MAEVAFPASAKRAARRILGPNSVAALKAGWRSVAGTVAFAGRRLALQAEDAWQRGDVATAERLWTELARRQPLSPTWALKLSAAANSRADYERAEGVLLEARARGAGGDELESQILHYARWRRVSNAAIEDALAAVSDPAGSPFKAFYSAVYLSSEGMSAAARAGLERLAGHCRLGHLARAQLAALDVLENDKQGAKNIPGWLSPARNSAIVRQPGSDTVVVGFAPPGGLFGVPVNAIHAMFASAGVNAIYLYDSQQLFHLNGSDRFGTGYDAMLDGVRKMIAEMGARNVITFGVSGTGYTALRAGLDLGADGVVAFSPVTSLAPGADPRMPQIKFRLREQVPHMKADLQSELRRRQSCARIKIYYSGANPQDCIHAQRLAGIPGVTLHEVEGLERHDCVSELVIRGETDVLAEFRKEA